jgi:hypothetical protein
VVAREAWSWALRRWDKLDWLPGVDTKLVDWWTVDVSFVPGDAEARLVDGALPCLLVHLASPE